MINVGIIDYGGGNLRSLSRAVESLGHEVTLVSGPEQFRGLTHLLFPGQGAYGDCLRKLKERGLVRPLLSWIEENKPFFGICVGFQLLFRGSEEAPDKEGFSVFRGEVVRFQSKVLKIPHMGWNALRISHPEHHVWEGLPENPYFYFVHSYHATQVEEEVISGTCLYGEEFTACVLRGNLLATQFHPEKSQENGLILIKNFLKF